ncbi:MAG TPA: lysylphosphatidylglycerol synthase domain-containing protein, partial [Gaiellaceae bacterium]|nr:lysylphosphatidylglycerol synthase domain-containing protein [Gaiellaceae bacterium]
MVTAACFAILFSRIPMAQVATTLATAPWGRFLLLMAPYVAFYVVVDSFVVQQAVSWFNVRVSYRDILPVRATAYILALVNTLLGQGGVALYLHRRHGLPFWEITGTVVFIAFVEIYQLALYSFVGAAAAGELGKRAPVVIYVVLAAYLAFHLWYFSRPRAGRLAELRVLSTFRRARPSHYLRLLAYKTPNLLAAVTVHWLALPLFGMHVPFLVLLTYLPMVFFFAALPIAAAHLGPSQLAWVFFFGPWVEGGDIL